MTAQRKRLVLIACILGSTVVTVDSTVVNVALPAISKDLGGGLAGQQWTSNAYLVTLASLLLIGGSLGDVLGERRVFALGVVAFGVTSIVCALAPSIEVLVLGRALQGMAGALLTPAALAVIVATFPRSERGKAVGTWTAWSGIGVVFGPLVGGQLVDTVSWRWIFALNLPLVIGTLLLILRVVPQSRERDPDARVDYLGGALCALGLAGITFGLIEQPLRGWGDPAVLLSLVIGAALFAGFLVYESRIEHPMLPLGLFKRHNFTAGNIQTFAMYGGLGVVFFLLVLYLQQVAGYSALAAGAVSLPLVIMMFLLAARFGALADRYGPRLFMGGGAMVAAAGIALISLGVSPDVNFATDLLPGVTLFGLGLSMTVAPLTATVLADADERNAGVASGVNNAIARVAGLVAIAVVGAIVTAQMGARLDKELGSLLDRPAVAAAAKEAKRQSLAKPQPKGVTPREARRVVQASEDAATSGFRLGTGIAAVLVALGGVVGLVLVRNPRREVSSEDCPGGQLAGQPAEAARQSPCDWHREPAAAPSG